MTLQGDRLDRGMVGSVLLHGLLFTLVLLSPRFLFKLAPNWGSPTGGAGGISVKVVGSAAGIPLPTPPVVNETAPANESPGLYKTEPAAKPAPDKKAEPIPEKKTPVKKTPLPKEKAASPPTPKTTVKETEPPPSNAIPYGQGGRPSMTYG